MRHTLRRYCLTTTLCMLRVRLLQRRMSLSSGRICFYRKSSLLVLVLMMAGFLSTMAQQPQSIPEEIEWTWEVRPAHPDAKLPNVLLLGDSISRNYFPEVTKHLEGVANVYLMASSSCVGDPRLLRQIAEFAALERVRFRVVHFNNGMHGWAYNEAEYRTAFPAFLRAVRSLVDKDGTLIWTSTTPVRPGANNGASNTRIEERNAIALAFVKPAGVLIDDQHALMMQHGDLHEDDVHFNPAGARIQGSQVVSSIWSALVGLH
jgi:hypothetical protein